MATKGVPASQLLLELVDKTKDKEVISLGEINNHLSECGFAILMILFAFPMAIPLPYPPGFTTVLGIPLFIFSIQMIMKMDKPFLPHWISKREIKVSHLCFAIEKSTKYFLKAEKVLKPRLPYFSSYSGERLIGVMSLLCSVSVILPIMFGNAIPSAGICIMALGLLSKDGVVIIVGTIVSVIGLFVSAMVVYFLAMGVKIIAGNLFF